MKFKNPNKPKQPTREERMRLALKQVQEQAEMLQRCNVITFGGKRNEWFKT